MTSKFTNIIILLTTFKQKLQTLKNNIDELLNDLEEDLDPEVESDFEIDGIKSNLQLQAEYRY